MAKKKIFLLTWKTTTSKYQIVKGDDIADACNNAGIGHGAITALDLYVDVTVFFRGGTLLKCLKYISEWDEKGGYWWRRETCVKLERQFLVDGFFKPEDTGKTYKGWKINDAGRYLLTKVEEACSKT